jgi:hypothetical protein
VVFAITEPNAGSNTHRIETAAVHDNGDFLLNGTKYYTPIRLFRTGPAATNSSKLASLRW